MLPSLSREQQRILESHPEPSFYTTPPFCATKESQSERLETA